jgi:endonuclease/exonuclease/phosphatase family metal-dependent hydrolase
VGTFNIHRGRNADGDFDLARTAACLQDLQVVGLNEVGGAYWWQEGDQAELLGRQLHLPWLFAPTTRRWWRDDFGNGLLCSLPVGSWRRVLLTCTRGKGYRNYTLAELQWDRRTLSLLVTHLDRVQDRAAQLKTVIEAFLTLPEPALLMGDLNSAADDPQLQRLLSTAGIHDTVAEGLGGDAPRRIDWILARGLRGVAAGVVDTGASDHPLVWAELAPLAEP